VAKKSTVQKPKAKALIAPRRASTALPPVAAAPLAEPEPDGFAAELVPVVDAEPGAEPELAARLVDAEALADVDAGLLSELEEPELLPPPSDSALALNAAAVCSPTTAGLTEKTMPDWQSLFADEKNQIGWVSFTLRA